MANQVDISLVISFVLSYIHAILLNVIYLVLTYTNDSVLRMFAPLWIVGNTDDDDGYMTDDDFVLHGKDRYIVSVLDNYILKDKSITCIPHLGVKAGSVFINMAMTVDVVVDHSYTYKYKMVNVNTITNKLRCLLYVRGRLTLPDIYNITEGASDYIIILYNTYEGKLMEQIINTKQRKEVLTGKDIMFGMLLL